MFNSNLNKPLETGYYTQNSKFDWNTLVVPNSTYQSLFNMEVLSNQLLSDLRQKNTFNKQTNIKSDKYLYKSSLKTFIKEVISIFKSNNQAGLYLKSNDKIYNNDDVIKSINELTCKSIFEDTFKEELPLFNFDDIVSYALYDNSYDVPTLNASLFFDKLLTQFQIINLRPFNPNIIKLWTQYSANLFCVVLHWLIIESKKQFHQYFLIVFESGFYTILYPLFASINYLFNLKFNLNNNWSYNGYEIYTKEIKT